MLSKIENSSGGEKEKPCTIISDKIQFLDKNFKREKEFNNGLETIRKEKNRN